MLQVLHNTTQYFSVLQSASPFDSRSKWNIQYIARSNVWDAKHNGTTTFIFDSRNMSQHTAGQHIIQSNIRFNHFFSTTSKPTVKGS